MRDHIFRRIFHSQSSKAIILITLSSLCFGGGKAKETTSTFQPSASGTLPAASIETLPYNATNCHDWWEYEGRSSLEDQPVTQYVIAILQILVALLTIAGNLLVIIAVSVFHELQTITNMFVSSLACADLIMGAFVMPVGIPYVMNGRWGLGALFCDLWISIDVLVVTASIETLCAIALDRYLAITKPFSYTANVTRSRARCLIAFIWITAASIAFIPVQLGWWKDNSFEATCCYETEACCEFMTNKSYAIVSSAVSFYIPTALMIFSYAIVFKEAIRLASQIDDQSGMIRRASMPGTNRPLWNREQRRTVFTFGYIMGIFTMCWLPFFIVNPAQAINPGCIPSSVFTSLNWFGYANSFFNPFIYSHNAQFRQAFVRLLTCLPCSEGFQRTKRASLSDSFPRYRSGGSRDSTIHAAISSFFLVGGSSRKRSTRRSAGSTILKRDSTISGGRSPNRSPLRQTRFLIGSDENGSSSKLSNTDNNNDSENEVFKIDSSRGGTPTILIATPADNSTRNVTFFDNGYHRLKSLYSASDNGRTAIDDERAVPNGTGNRVEDSTSSQHSSLADTLNCNAELATLLPNGGAVRPVRNGRHEIRTRRTRSLIVSGPDGMYLRNHSTNSSSSATDVVALGVGENVPLNASQPDLSKFGFETHRHDSSEYMTG